MPAARHFNIGIMQSTGNAFKKITYDYDLISGKVNNVSYQPGTYDQFHHRYEYDAENRITRVHTSGDGVIWETDARYYYYRHGPLARTETRDLLVQGTDYAYTLQSLSRPRDGSWLKGVNSSALDPAHDMGEDGSSTSIVARDVYGFSLHYYNTDFTQINTSKTVFAPVNTTVLTGFKPLFNGNIAAMAVNIGQFDRPLIYNYGYDQLNRLVAMDAYTGLNSSTNAWTPVHTSDYRERISYDGNGNILTYRRFGTTLNGNSLPMDSLDYNYAYDGSGRLLNNQLEYVDDHVSSAYTTDIDDQSTGNYTYDAIGNLVTDDQEGISEISWNVYGKISNIEKSSITISYDYDASGNRIGKTVDDNTVEKHTWYVRDASGNVMAVYEDGNSSINSNALSQIEVHLYGSARLGMWQANRNVVSPPQPIETALTGLVEGGVTIGRERGEKIFELSNHLGNVLVTISDRRVEYNTSGTAIDYYEASVVSASDYYPFGMGMAERKYTSYSYRFGFNGQEKENDINENLTYAMYWEYDGRIGRRWNRDPIVRSSRSPYSCFNNNPIVFADPLGLDGVPKKHQVKNGDNFWDLENSLGLDHGSLQKWNPGVNPRKLKIGSLINISDPSHDLLLGVSGKLHSKESDDPEAEDARSSVGGLPSTRMGKKLTRGLSNNPNDQNNLQLSNDFLERKYTAVSTTATLLKRNDDEWFKDETRLYDLFFKNKQESLTNHNTYGIAKEIRKSVEFGYTIFELGRTFKDGMNSEKGEYWKIDLSRLPVPSWDLSNPPLLALVGSIQQINVFLSDIQIHGTSYTAAFKIDMYDQFGVSENDFAKYGTGSGPKAIIRDAIIAFWILQHNRGYKPFINVFKYEYTIKGTFNR